MFEFKTIIDHIKSLYPNKNAIALHEPYFDDKEKEYLLNCIDSTYVSSVGEYVDKFESMISNFTGSKHSVATVNGTTALHLALLVAEVNQGDEVITQSLNFVATANAIHYVGAHPVFIDCSYDNLSMDPNDLEKFLLEKATMKDDGFCYNKATGKKLKLVSPCIL